MKEICFFGRGGHGVVIASQMLGYAFFKDGEYPQCFSVFGGERRGAPLESFLRVDDQKILLKCEIKTPTEMIFFDESLLNPETIKSHLSYSGCILINTKMGADAFGKLSDYRLGLVDGPKIARSEGLAPFFNTVMLGAYVGFQGAPSLASLEAAIMEMSPNNPELNVDAARLAYESVIIVEPGDGDAS
jgi:2-oxoacid:acceptor oxidoreductase gamma subunit (pyruvate/2-ketoisovalerate family)